MGRAVAPMEQSTRGIKLHITFTNLEANRITEINTGPQNFVDPPQALDIPTTADPFNY